MSRLTTQHTPYLLATSDFDRMHRKLSDAHRRAIDKHRRELLCAEFKQGTHIERLYASGKTIVMSTRIGGGARVVLSPLRVGDHQAWLLLDILPTHKYTANKYLKGRTLDNYIARHGEEIQAKISGAYTDTISVIGNTGAEIDKLDAADESEVSATQPERELFDIDFFNHHIMATDETQADCLFSLTRGLCSHTPFTAHIIGVAGSGKSGILNQLIDYLNESPDANTPITYVARSPKLRRDMRNQWLRSPFCTADNRDSVQFVTKEELFAKAGLLKQVGLAVDKTPVNPLCHRELFARRKKHHIKVETAKKNNKLAEFLNQLSYDDYYQEALVMAGCRDIGRYREHFASHSPFSNKPELQEFLWETLQCYRDSIDVTEYDSQFSDLPVNEDHSQAGIVLCDEWQDEGLLVSQKIRKLFSRVVFTGDDNQNLYSRSRSLTTLKRDMQLSLPHGRTQYFSELEKTYRCPRGIARTASAFADIYWKLTGGRNKGVTKKVVSALATQGSVSVMNISACFNPAASQGSQDSACARLEKIKQLCRSTACSVIYDPEKASANHYAPASCKKIREITGTAQVVTSEDIKGMGCKVAIIWDYFSDNEAKRYLELMQQEGASRGEVSAKDLSLITRVNEAFVAITRAEHAVVFVQTSPSRNVAELLKLLSSLSNEPSDKHDHVDERDIAQLAQVESQKTDWIIQSIRHWLDGRQNIAKEVALQHGFDLPAILSAVECRQQNNSAEAKKILMGLGLSLEIIEPIVTELGVADAAKQVDNPGGGPAEQVDNPGGGPAEQVDNPGGGPAKQVDNPGGGPAEQVNNPGGGPAEAADDSEQEKTAKFTVEFETERRVQIKVRRRRKGGGGKGKKHAPKITKIIKIKHSVDFLRPIDEGTLKTLSALPEAELDKIEAHHLVAMLAVDIHQDFKRLTTNWEDRTQQSIVIVEPYLLFFKKQLQKISDINVASLPTDFREKAQGVSCILGLSCYSPELKVEVFGNLSFSVCQFIASSTLWSDIAAPLEDWVNKPVCDATVSGWLPFELSASLHIAVELNRLDHVKKLVAEGVDINVTDRIGDTVLHKACRCKHGGIVQYLLSSGAAVDITSSLGYTAFHVAVYGGQKAIVAFLLEHKAIASQINVPWPAGKHKGRTLLQAAAQDGCADLVDVFLKHGAKIQPRTNEWNALHYATVKGHQDCCDKLLENEQFYLDMKLGDGRNCLHIAIEKKHTEFAIHLLELDSAKNLDTPLQSGDYKGYTALCLAADYGNAAIISALLDKGFDTTAEVAGGANALHIAAMKGNKGCVEALLQSEQFSLGMKRKGDEANILHIAISCNHTELALYLLSLDDAHELDTRICITKKNTKDYTVLCFAAGLGNVDIVSMLLDRNFSKAHVGFSGACALHTAAALGRLGVVKVFLDRRVFELNQTDKFNETALHKACVNRRVDVAMYLLKIDSISIDVISSYGFTPLHISAKAGGIMQKVTRLMLQHGDMAKVISKPAEGTKSRGLTPLALAVIKGDAEMMNVLLDAGADQKPSASGRSVLHYAIQNCKLVRADVLTELLRRKVIASQVNLPWPQGAQYQGQTPMQVAARHGRADLVDVLLKHGAAINPLPNQCNALHFAAYYGHQRCVEVLLKNEQFHLGMKLSDGKNCLHMAIECNHTELARYLLLLDNESELNTPVGEFGFSALHWAACNAKVEMFSCLLQEFNADTTVTGNNQVTVLFAAIEGGSFEIIQQLPYDARPLQRRADGLRQWADRQPDAIKQRMLTHVGDAADDDIVKVTPEQMADIMGCPAAVKQRLLALKRQAQQGDPTLLGADQRFFLARPRPRSKSVERYATATKDSTAKRHRSAPPELAL